jgi:uncharacterized protein
VRVFLDANVLFSAALKPSSRINALFDLSEAGFCELFTSPHVVLEARRNIQNKFPAQLSDLERLLASTVLVSEADKALVMWARQHLPDKDAPVLAAALACVADVLVTGDGKHFGDMFEKTYRGVLVLTPAQALTYLTEIK